MDFLNKTVVYVPVFHCTLEKMNCEIESAGCKYIISTLIF